MSHHMKECEAMAMALAAGVIPEEEVPEVNRVLDLSSAMAHIQETFDSCIGDETKTVADFQAAINNLSVHNGN